MEISYPLLFIHSGIALVSVATYRFFPAKRKESKSNDIPRNKVISSVNFTFFNSFKVIEMQN